MFPSLPGLSLPGVNVGGGLGGNLSILAPLLASLGLSGVAGGAGTPTNTNTTSSSTGTSDVSSQSDTNNTLSTLLNFLNNFSQDTTGTTNTTGTSVQGTTPTLSPATQAFMDNLIGKYNAQSAPSLTGFGAQQTNNINVAADAQKKAIDNIMAARGLSTSPAAGTAQTGLEQNRLNQITSMQQGLPLLQNQMNLQNLAGASAFFSAIPKGSITTGSTAQQGQTTQNTTGQQSGQQTGSQTGSSSTTGSQKGTTTQTGTSSTVGSTGGGVGGAAAGLGGGLATILPYLVQIFGAKPATP
jgi:hypothetical protein